MFPVGSAKLIRFIIPSSLLLRSAKGTTKKRGKGYKINLKAKEYIFTIMTFTLNSNKPKYLNNYKSSHLIQSYQIIHLIS
jgi:hypothetical protein